MLSQGNANLNFMFIVTLEVELTFAKLNLNLSYRDVNDSNMVVGSTLPTNNKQTHKLLFDNTV